MIQTGWQAKALASTACLRDAVAEGTFVLPRVGCFRTQIMKRRFAFWDTGEIHLSAHLPLRMDAGKKKSGIFCWRDSIAYSKEPPLVRSLTEPAKPIFLFVKIV